MVHLREYRDRGGATPLIGRSQRTRSKEGSIAPFDGDRRFTSAMTDRPPPASAPAKLRGTGAIDAATRRVSSRDMTSGRRVRTEARMS